MEIRQFLEFIIRNKKLFISVFVLFFLLSLAAAFFYSDDYSSSVKMSVIQDTGMADLIFSGDPANKSLMPRKQLIDRTIELMKDGRVMNEVIRTLDLRGADGERILPEDLLAKVNISYLKDTDVIQVAAFSKDPGEAADIANSVAEQYIEWKNALNSSEAAAIKALLPAKISAAAGSVKAARNAVSLFAKKHKGLAEIPADISDEIQKLSDIETEILKYSVVQAALGEKYTMIEDEPLFESAESRKKILARSSGTLKEEISGAEVGQAMLKYAALVRDSRISENKYGMLQDIAQKIKSFEEMIPVGTRIVSRAQPQKPQIRQNKIFILIIGTVLGFLFAGTAVFIAEYLDPTLKSGDEAGAAAKLDLLDMSLYLKEPARPLCLMFASPAREEVSASAALEFSVICARSGKKTLFINAEPKGTIIEKGKQPLIDTEIPGLSTEELKAERIKDIISSLREQYEMIVINSPAVIGCPDALSIALSCDTVCLVVTCAATKRNNLIEARNILSGARCNIAGFIFEKGKNIII